jgi:hypothetical protein
MKIAVVLFLVETASTTGVSAGGTKHNRGGALRELMVEMAKSRMPTFSLLICPSD